MMRRFVLGCCVLVALGAGQLQAATIVVDQQQLAGFPNLAGFGQADLAQSFQQSRSNITGAAIFVGGRVADTGTITISLYNALPNAGGSLLASGSTTVTVGSNSPVWATVDFGGPVAIAADQTHYLVFTDTMSSLSYIYGALDNPYSRGQAYANPGFQGFSQYDYTFKTFAREIVPGEEDGSTVPEPATLSLLAVGAAGMAGYRLRRKKAANA